MIQEELASSSEEMSTSTSGHADPQPSTQQELPPQPTTPRTPLQLLQQTTFFPASAEGTPIPPMSAGAVLEQKFFGADFPSSSEPGTSAAEAAPALRRVGSSGVVRRKSWRTHYVRPNKSFEQETNTPKVEIGESSHSTPIRRSSSRRSANGNGHRTFQLESRKVVRRRSSGNGNGKSSKAPVQPRRSTQI